MASTSSAFPTTIHFGAGARKLVAAHLQAQGVAAAAARHRPRHRGAAAPAGVPARACPASPSPCTRTSGATRCAAQVDGTARPRYRAHRADAVIGLGGGAALDVAKAIALMADHPGDMLEYAWDHPQVRPIDRPMPYFVALPTTAGTGSEVGRSAVISDDATHVKKIIFSPRLLAKAVFADPGAHARPAAGDHRGDRHGRADPQRRVVPVAGVSPAVRRHRARRRAHRRARAAGRGAATAATSRRARDMLMSSMMGAIAFQKDLGAVHSCAHALSTVADLHHGLANGIMIDHVMRFNLPAADGEDGRARARRARAGRRRRQRRGRAARRSSPGSRQLKRELGIPAKLGRLRGRGRVDAGRHSAPGRGRASPTPATRPIRASARAADFERIFAAAL